MLGKRIRSRQKKINVEHIKILTGGRWDYDTHKP